MAKDLSSSEEFNELSFYTLNHPDTVYFIHQHIVDAFGAQTADENTKLIRIIFSLVGLYLYIEKRCTGKEVQQAHLKLADRKKLWPMQALPKQRGTITVSDVLKTPPGPARDGAIKDWCSSVWAAYKNWHEQIATLAKTELGVK